MKKKNEFYESLVCGLNDAAEGNVTITDKKQSSFLLNAFLKMKLKQLESTQT